MTDTADLCEKLRSAPTSILIASSMVPVLRNPDGPRAADTLERQAAEIERLRAALDRIAYVTAVTFGSDGHPEVNEIARAALTGEEA